MIRHLLLIPLSVRLIAFALLGGVIFASLPPAARAQSDDIFQDAEKKFDAGNYEEALKGFQRFQVERKYSSIAARAIYMEGWCLFNMKKYKEAADKFEAVTKRPEPQAASIVPEALLKQAECYRELEQYDRSIELYKDFQKRFPEHALASQAFLGEAWVLYKKKDYDNAAKLTQNIKTRFAQDPQARLDSLFLLAQIYTEQEKFDEARKVYDEIKSMRYNPRASEALFLAGETMYEGGNKLMDEGKSELGLKRFADAIGYYQSVQSKDSLLAQIDFQIKDLRSRLIKERDKKSFLQATIDSLSKFKGQLNTRPDLRPVALYRTGNCYQSLAKPEEGALVFRHFNRLYPDADKMLRGQAQFGLVQTLTASGRAEEAEKETAILNKEFPDLEGLTKSALFMSGKSKFDQANYKGAIEDFNKFLGTKPDEQLAETAEFYIHASYYGMGEYPKAVEEFKKFIEKRPKSAFLNDAKFRIGRANFEMFKKLDEKKPEEVKPEDKEAKKQYLLEAIKHYEEVRSSDKPELKPDVTFQLGYLYNFMTVEDPSNYTKSADAFEDYVKQWPDKELVPEALYQLARNRFGAKDSDRAITAYNQLVERFPASTVAPHGAFEIAVVYGSATNSVEMIKALRSYIQKFPNHEKVSDAYFAIANDFKAKKQLDQAITEYRGLIDFTANAGNTNPELIKAAIAAQIQVAGILEGSKKIEEAVKSCLDFLKKFPNSPDAAQAMISQIAGIYARAKLHDRAYVHLETLAKEHIANATIRVPAYQNLIEISLVKRDYEKAYGFGLTLQNDPDRENLAGAYLAVGNAMHKTAHEAEARDAFKKLVTKYPDDPRYTAQGWVGLGNAEFELKNLPGAEEAFKKALQPPFDQPPAVIDATLGYAKVLEANGDLKQAVPLYDKVLRHNRGDAPIEAAFRLGMIAYNNKDYKPALPLFARLLLASGPLSEEAAFRTAMCHKFLGNVVMARNSFNSYIGRYCKNPDALGKFCTEAQQELNALPQPQQP